MQLLAVDSKTSYFGEGAKGLNNISRVVVLVIDVIVFFDVVADDIRSRVYPLPFFAPCENAVSNE